MRTKYRDPTPPRQRKTEQEHTFKPAVNNVSKDMVSVQLYLEVDPFERLSRTKSNAGEQQEQQDYPITPNQKRPSSAPPTYSLSNSCV